MSSPEKFICFLITFKPSGKFDVFQKYISKSCSWKKKNTYFTKIPLRLLLYVVFLARNAIRTSKVSNSSTNKHIHPQLKFSCSYEKCITICKIQKPNPLYCFAQKTVLRRYCGFSDHPGIGTWIGSWIRIRFIIIIIFFFFTSHQQLFRECSCCDRC